MAPSRSSPFVLPFDGVSPVFGDGSVCGPRVSILGKATIGDRALFGAGVVIRADGHVVQIGDDVVLGQDSTVHIAHGIYPCIIGNRVSVGRNSVVHACTVGDDCVIGHDVVILDGAVIEDGVAIESGSTVFPRKTLRAGLLYGGSPVEELGELSVGERAVRAAVLRRAAQSDRSAERSTGALAEHPDAFVADTAILTGSIELGPHSSVFFGCDLDAGSARITVGSKTNIQDNTKITCRSSGVTIGADTTLGHNVIVEDCTIGASTLIGMGATLAAGTLVDDDVLLAAGAFTEPGQHLEGGWLWGGRPARPMSRLNDARRQMMRDTITHYCAYGDAFRAAQEHLAKKAE